MSGQIKQLKAHAEHLLDAFLILRETYAILEPMIFDEKVCHLRGNGKQSRGFLILRNSLYLSCVQDIAKLTLDSDQRSPSIINLVSALKLSNLRDELREEYSNWLVPEYDMETDPAIIKALQKMKVREQQDRRDDFDRLYEEIEERWVLLSECRSMGSFLTIRDKISVHKEVHLVADKYQFVDIETFGLVWDDLRYAICQMQRLVEILQLLIRNSGMAWDLEEERFTTLGKDFWLGTHETN